MMLIRFFKIRNFLAELAKAQRKLTACFARCTLINADNIFKDLFAFICVHLRSSAEKFFSAYSASSARDILNHVHLQWFAAEDEGRTEDPTEQKIRKAREEGKVARSAELSSAVVLLFPVICLILLSKYFLDSMKDMLSYFISLISDKYSADSMILFYAFFKYFIKLTLPIALIALIAAFAGNVFQVGFMFTSKPIKPDFSKIVPHFARFFKRAMFSSEAMFNLGKSIFKIIVISVITYLNVKAKLDTIIQLSSYPFGYGFSFILKITFMILFESAIALLVLSVPDYIFQKRLHKKSLMMSKYEVKEERKMTEGDPLIKSRLRERMRQLLTKNIVKNVKEADVVITNPTHFAVVLQWKKETMDAPMITAKGMDSLALRIKEIAGENRVPIMENKPLARALYQELEVGDIVPEKYYEVISIVYSEIYRMKGINAEAI